VSACPCVCTDVHVCGLGHTSPGARVTSLFQRAHLWTSAGAGVCICASGRGRGAHPCRHGRARALTHAYKALPSCPCPEILSTLTSAPIRYQAPGAPGCPAHPQTPSPSGPRPRSPSPCSASLTPTPRLRDLGVPAPSPHPPGPPADTGSPRGVLLAGTQSWWREGGLTAQGGARARLQGGSSEPCRRERASGPSPEEGGPEAEQEAPGQGPEAAPRPRPPVAQVSPATVHVHF